MAPDPQEIIDLPRLEDFLRRPDWHADAACREHPMEIIFPERGGDTRAARGICGGCLVRSECLAWSLDQDATLLGVWGGRGAGDRKALRRSCASSHE